MLWKTTSGTMLASALEAAIPRLGDFKTSEVLKTRKSRMDVFCGCEARRCVISPRRAIQFPVLPQTSEVFETSDVSA